MSVRNVSSPTLTPVLPVGNQTGAAVIVAAGGGYLIQSMGNEAWPQARWLADRGIAVFILKYRLEPTPGPDDQFRAALIDRFVEAADPAERSGISVPFYMIEDASAAIGMVRARSIEWGIDPERIGYLGFSAGAMIGLGVVADARREAMPNFLGAIYPSMADVDVAAEAPPLFLAMAGDDQLYGKQGYGLAESWRRADRSVEMHVYAKGGHGFGMGVLGTTSTGMMDSFHAWLESGGWLNNTKTGGRP